MPLGSLEPSRSVPSATNKKDKMMGITALIIVASSVGATLAVLLIFAAGWMAASRIGSVARVEPSGGLTPIAVETGVALRITLADVRERLRRLEAIAAGIDL